MIYETTLNEIKKMAHERGVKVFQGKGYVYAVAPFGFSFYEDNCNVYHPSHLDLERWTETIDFKIKEVAKEQHTSYTLLVAKFIAAAELESKIDRIENKVNRGVDNDKEAELIYEVNRLLKAQYKLVQNNQIVMFHGKQIN